MKNYSSVLIIYNPNAMKGNIDNVMPYIKKRLSVRFAQIDSIVSASGGSAEELAQKNASKYDIIIACGGDGTIHNVINGVMKSGYTPVVGLLPFGSCNDLARTLHVPIELDKAIDCILRLNKTNYDLMFDGENYIIYSLATGYLTKTSYKTSERLKKRFGRFAYILSGIKYFFNLKPIPLTVTCGEERIHGKFVYMMLLNGESAGGFTLNKGEDLSNSKVKLVMVKQGKGLSAWFSFIKLFTRGIKSVSKSKHVIVRDVENCEIENPSNEVFAIDGEAGKFLKKKIYVDGTLTMIKN